jgi:hypothetical protein
MLFGMNNATSKVMTDAKARIIWGESPQSVRDFLRACLKTPQGLAKRVSINLIIATQMMTSPVRAWRS